MPNTTVQILFSGLIGFSPNSASPPTELAVLIANGNNYAQMAHRSYLTVISDSKPEGDFDFLGDPVIGFPAVRTFIGGGYRIAVSPKSTEAFSYDRCRVAMPNTQSDGKEKICLISGKELVDAGGKARMEMIAGQDKSVSKELANWFSIDHGNFGPLAEQLYRDEANELGPLFRTFGRELSWSSGQDDKVISRFTPELLIWQFELPGTVDIVMTFRRFGEIADSGKIVLKPDANGYVRLLISNEPEPLEYCLESRRGERYSAGHLKHVMHRLTSGANTFKRPELLRAADRSVIDKFCIGLGKQAGRQPVICYGVELERP